MMTMTLEPLRRAPSGEIRWRLLQMVAEDGAQGRPQLVAEMSPLFPELPRAEVAEALSVVLRGLAAGGLVERHGALWRATRRGHDLVRHRRGR